MNISVIIPFYKNSQTIKRALESVISQSIQPLEILIINDASPDWDETLPIINCLDISYLKTISHPTNKNGAAARNTGIHTAKGEYIAFLDADDEWLSSHLEESLEKITNENTDISYSQAKVNTRYGISIMPNIGIIDAQSISDYLFVQGAVMFTPTLMVKTSLAQLILFNDKLRRHQDYDFLLRCEAYGVKISFVKKPNVIVHWGNNEPKIKGGTWDFSFSFALNYKRYFTPKAHSRFILKNCVLKLLEDRKRFTALKLFCKNINPIHLDGLNYYFIVSYFVFGEFKHPFKWKK